ncbi:MAG: hypothetical protein LBR83_10870 [Clostridiales bacterium]|jgi:surface polysaccharide O-acyltransferase-like enzyme|nr:hypothetical protein [Clostridiales bacterium]
MKRQYVKDYELTEDKKRLVYRGAIFTADMPEGELRRAKTRMVLFAVLNGAAYLLAGVLGNQTTRTFYAGIPYALLVFPAAFAVIDAVKFYLRGAELERAHYEGSFLHLLVWSLTGMLFSAAAAVGGIIYLVRAAQPPLAEYFFPALAAAMCALALLLWKQARIVNKNIREKDVSV